MKKVDIDGNYAENRHAIYSTESRGLHSGFVKLLGPPIKNFRGSYLVSVQRVDIVCQVGDEETGLIVARFNEGFSNTVFSARYSYVYKVTLPQLTELFAHSEEEFILRRVSDATAAHERNLARLETQRVMRHEKDEEARLVQEFVVHANEAIRIATGTETGIKLRTIHAGRVELSVKLDELPVISNALTKLVWKCTELPVST